jgi:hypothetical protein
VSKVTPLYVAGQDAKIISIEVENPICEISNLRQLLTKNPALSNQQRLYLRISFNCTWSAESAELE